MTRDKKEVEASLIKKGFRTKENDHRYFIYYDTTGKKQPILTKTSHSMKCISDDLLVQMSKQCKLTKKQFLDLVDCPLNRTEYEKIISDKLILK
jgi:hypothetical protein